MRFLPKEFSCFEPEVRKWVVDSSMRGQITLRVYFSPSMTGLMDRLPKPEILRHLKLTWEKISVSAGFDPKQVDLPFVLLHFPFQQRADLIRDEEVEFLKKSVQEALADLKNMKLKEGRVLAQDLAFRLQSLQEITIQIESLLPEAIRLMKERWQEKMKELLKINEDIEGKILREVAVFCERSDITEEIVRLKSHFLQFQEILESNKGGFVGRKMDFLIQEIGREINTIGSKSTDTQISYRVVEMKDELKKMREQIQNIE